MAKALNVSLAVTADTGQAKAALQQLQTLLTQLTTQHTLNFNTASLTKDLQQASYAATQLQAHLQKATNMQTGALDFSKLSNSIRASGSDLQSYANQLLKLGPTGQQAFSQLATAVARSEVPMKRLSGVLGEFGTVLQNTIRWQLSSSFIHGFMGTVQQAFHYAQDLNESLNRIQIVTQNSDENMAKFAQHANEAAKRLSTTTTTYTDASLIYYQQGLTDKEVAERTEVTIKMANAAGVSAQKVSDQMTAVWNNFDNGSHSLEYYADVMTALGAATASSTDEISTGLSKFASVADAVGLSYENAAAALATITATTRNSADSVGTGLRTLFSRLQSVKLGETLEDGVDLTKYSKAIATMGVNILDANGQLKSMDNILDEMGSKWQNLNNTQKVAIAQTVGGVRQYTNLIALLDNYDFYKQNQQIALNSEGTVQKQADIYAQSWEAAQKRVKASAESIYSSLINDKFFINFNNSLAKTLDIINSVIKGLGGVKGILSGVAAIGMKAFAPQITKGLTDFANNTKNLFRSSESINKERQDFLTNAAQQLVNPNNPSLADQTRVENMRLELDLESQLVAKAQQLNAIEMAGARAQIDAVRARNQMVVAKQKELDIATTSRRKGQNNLYEWGFGTGAINNAQDIQRFGARVQGLQTQQKVLAEFRDNMQSAVDSGMQSNELIALFNSEMAKLNQAGTLGQNQANIMALAQQAFNKTQDAEGVQTAIDTIMAGYKSGTLKAWKNSMAKFLSKGQSAYGDDKDLDAEIDNMINAAADEAARAAEEARIRANTKAQNDKTKQEFLNLGKINQTTQGIVQLGQAISSITAARAGIESIGAAFKGISDGSLSAAEGIAQLTSALGQTVMMGAMGFQSMQASLQSFGMTAAAAVPWAAAIEAALILLPNIISAVDKLIVTPQESLDLIADETDAAATAANQAKQAYDALLNDFSAHNNLQNTLDSLTEGTLEFKQALQEANESALDLIEKYHITEGVSYENGRIVISKSAQQAIEEEKYKEIGETSELYRVSQARQSYAQVKKNWQDIQDQIQSWANEVQFAYGIDANSPEARAKVGEIYGKYLEEDLKPYGVSVQDALNNNFEDYLLKSNAAVTNQNALRTLAGKDNEISEIESILIDQLSTNTELWDKIEEASETFDLEGRKVDLKKASASDLKTIYSQLFSAAEYDDFVKDSGLSGDDLQAALRSVIRNTLSRNATEAAWEEARAELKNPKLLKLTETSANTPYKQTIQKISDLLVNEKLSSAEEAFLKSLQAQYTKTAGDFTNKALEYGLLDTEALSSTFFGNLENLSFKDMGYISEAATNFGLAFGEISATKIFQTLTEEMSQGNNTLASIYDQVDWNGSTIGIISSFKDNLEKAGLTETYQDITKAMIQDAGGLGGMLEELVQSEDFKKPLKTLQKQLDKTGKLGASDIESIVAQMEDLDSWLDVAGVSAETLGEILSSLMLGDLDLSELSDGLLEALDIANELENNVGEVFAHIDSYKEERSIRDIGKFYKGLTETIEDSMGAGFLLDAPLLQDWQEIFGYDSLQAYKRWAKDITSQAAGNLSPEEISKSFQGTFGAEIAAMQSIQQNGNLSGVYKYALDKNAGGTYKGTAISDLLKFNEETGQVITQNDENFFKMFKDQQSFIDFLQDGLHLTEDMAKAMTAELQATDAYAHDIWGQAATEKAVAHLQEQEQLSIKEIETFAKRNSEFLLKSGQELDDWVKDFVKAQEAAGKSVINLGEDFEHAKAQYQDLKDAMQKSANEGMGSTLETYLTNREKSGQLRRVTDASGKDVYLLKDLEQAYMGLGGTLADADRYIQQSGEDVGMYLVRPIKEAGAEAEKLKREFVSFNDEQYQKWATERGYEDLRSLEALQAYADYTANLASNMEYAKEMASTFTDTLIEGLTGLEINFEIDGQQITASINKAIDDADTDLEIDAITSAQPANPDNKPTYIDSQTEAFRQAAAEYEQKIQEFNAQTLESVSKINEATEESLSQISEQISTLESTQTEAVGEVASAVGQAKAELAAAQQEFQAAMDAASKSLEAQQQGNLAEAKALATEAQEHADKAANHAKIAEGFAKQAEIVSEESKKIQEQQKQLAEESAQRAKEAADATDAKMAEMQSLVDSLTNENQQYVSLLEEAGKAQQEAAEAAAEAAAAAMEGNLAAAEAAAQRAEEAAARAESIVESIAAKMEGQTTYEGETPTYSKEEQQGFVANAGAELKQDIQNVKDFAQNAWKEIKNSFRFTAEAEEMTQVGDGVVQLGEDYQEVVDTVNGNPITPSADDTSIEDSIDAIHRLGEARAELGAEAEANPVQLHTSADVNDPEKAKGVYDSYGLDYPQAGAETPHFTTEQQAEFLQEGRDFFNKLTGTADEMSDDVATLAHNSSEERQESHEITAYKKEGEKVSSKITSADTELVDAINKSGFGTSQRDLKTLENLSHTMEGLPEDLARAVENVKIESGTESVSAAHIQETATVQTELAKAINLKAHIDMDEAYDQVKSYIDLHPLDIPAKITEVNVDETTGDTEMVIQCDTEADVKQAKADIEALGGQILEENVNGDVTQLKVAIDGQNNRWLTAYVGGDVGALSSAISGQDGRHITVTVDYVEGDTSGLDAANGGRASGYNNGNGRFASGKYLGNKYWGMATVGELGPELLIHRGMPYLAGTHGRTRAYIEPNDEIYTAAETKRILETNPTLQDLPGFSVGYNKVSWGNDTSSGGGGGYGSGAKSSNKKTAKFDPERYHLISRQIDDITRRYERLDKIKDKAFGKNKIKAIQDEIDVTNDLIQAQEQLIHEANAYMNQDLATLRAYGVNVQLDKHGNLQNFEQLQEQYGRPATEAEDQDVKEYYSTIWKAIQQYEESVDKLNEAYEKYDDLIYQLAELGLEQFTARVEMKIDYDDKSIKLLDHYLGRINDDIYKTAEAFELTETKLDTNLHKLDTYYDGISKIMLTLHDQDGNLIQGMSLDKFLGLTDAQRDALKVSSDDMEAIADYLEDMIDVIEEMDDEKLDWAEKLTNAFDELNSKVESGLDLFTHYQTLLENIANISDLMGTGITKKSRDLLKSLNIGLLNNTKNSLTAAKDYLDTLEQAAAQTKWLLKNETDSDLKKEYQEELDEIESLIRDTQENILSYWETALQMAQDMFTQAMEQSLQDYERSFAGMYVSLDRWGEAYDRRKEIQQQYVEDYEKYYQLSKLDRDITKSIDELTTRSSKYHSGLAELLKEVQLYQKNGQKLSEYDIEVLQKKYDLEKARAELEEAREAKTTVRLQRNRDGSWGYVYTADEDKLEELQANLEEAIYNYQKLNDEQIHRLQDELVDFQQTMGEAVNDIMSDTTLTYQEKLYQIQELQKDYLAQQNFLFSELSKAMGTQGSTYSKAIDIYKGKTDELGNAFVDLEDTFKETVLSQLLGIKDLGAYKDEMVSNWEDLIKVSKEALLEYQENVDDINKTAGSSTKNFYNDATKWIEAIGETSGQTTSEVQKLGDELSSQFKRLAQEAKEFSQMWKEKMHEVTTSTEPFVQQMTAILALMNDAYDAFNIADGTATQVYSDIVTGTHTNHNLTGPDTSAVNTGIVNPYADIEAQYLALQQQLEDQYAMYQNEILNYYNEVQGNIMGALGELTNNWNSILNTQSSLMGYGLNTGLNYGGLGNIGAGWNQSVNIAADFPGVTSSFEIEEAFNNLVNKATQYANIPW